MAAPALKTCRGPGPTPATPSSEHGKWIKGARYSLLNRPENQTVRQLATLHDVQITNKPLYRAFLLLHELRGVYEVPAEHAPDALQAWLAWASRSKLKPFIKLARTIREHKTAILAAIELGVSNGRLEGLNSKSRLLSHRAYGFLPRRADRDDLPLLLRHHHQPPQKVTPNRSGEPKDHPRSPIINDVR